MTSVNALCRQPLTPLTVSQSSHVRNVQKGETTSEKTQDRFDIQRHKDGKFLCQTGITKSVVTTNYKPLGYTQWKLQHKN